MRSSLALLALVLLPCHALAEDGCDKFAWSLTRERTLLTASEKPNVKSGDELHAPLSAVLLQLKSGGGDYVLPPERAPKTASWFGGAMRVPAPEKAGVYQVSLSDEAWIDVVQDGRYARSVGSTGRSDCPGLRKSVRFELSASPFVVQISGVSSASIALTIDRAN